MVNRSIYKHYENSLLLIYCVKLDHAINYGISGENNKNVVLIIGNFTLIAARAVGTVTIRMVVSNSRKTAKQ